MNEVKCNNCDWEGMNSDLIDFSDEHGEGKGCPNCKTDAYLSDIYGSCSSCGKKTTQEELNENEGVCEDCYNTTILFDVYEDNGYGKTEKVGTYEVEGISVDSAKTSIDYYTELYSEKFSPKTETSFFYLKDPKEV